ncbi:stromelysin-3-like [Arctopsyche grandis]|uniref:stromelysin-3-like n=1 Tax=Arctopsyche grandis TaxID=121162 RepID=UPI00406D795F
MESSIKCVLFVLLQVLVLFAHSKPAPSRLPVIPSNDQMKFMQRFGYLGGDPSSDFAAQYTEESVVKAISNIQKYGGLQQTGIFDNKTIELMKKPRCGVKDIVQGHRPKRYVVAGRPWQKKELTYYIGNWNGDLGEQAVRESVRKALNLWAPYGKLTFIPSNNPSSDLKISFGVGNHGDQYPFDGRGYVLAHAFFPYVRDGGTVHFDNDELWTLNKTEEDEGTDFYSVAAHELGHALGLGHSTVPESIMFAYYKGGSMRLDYDDIMGMYELYIKQFGGEMPKREDNDDKSRESDQTQRPSPPKPPTTTTAKPRTTTTTAKPRTTRTTTKPRTTRTTTKPRATTSTTVRPALTFDGDFESVEDHKNKNGIPKVNENIRQLCKGVYDTVSVLRGELYVFKGRNVWRFQSKGVLHEGFPTTLTAMFPGLPESVKKIDAAYENALGQITFFSGSDHWILNGDHMGGPFSLEEYKVYNRTSINAVFLWPRNERTYLFKNDKFWRYNEKTNTLDDGYPMHMRRWKGIPENINSVINWIDGSTYFFKGLFYWRFDSELVEADKHYPLPAPQQWFGCPETPQIIQELRKLKRRKNRNADVHIN